MFCGMLKKKSPEIEVVSVKVIFILELQMEILGRELNPLCLCGVKKGRVLKYMLKL